MAKEQSYDRIEPVYFIEDGRENGIVTIESTIGFKVKRPIIVYSNSISTPKRLFVLRVLNETQMLLGPDKSKFNKKEDMSAYLLSDEAYLEAPEEERPNISPADYERAVYEEEPVVAKRVIPVDRLGNTYGKSHEGQQQIIEGSITGSVYNNLKLAYNATFQVQYIGESPFATLDSENKHFIQKIEYDSVLNATRILLATSSFENPEIKNITISAPYTINGDTFINLIANIGSFQELEPTDTGGTGLNGAKTEEELTTIKINTSLGLGQIFSGKIVEIVSNQEVVVKVDNGTPVEETTVSTQGDITTKSNREYSSLLNRSWNLREGYVYRVREDE